MNDLPKRIPIRLPDYDYSQNGAYFVTICTHGKKCVLSKITTAPVGAISDRPPYNELTQYGKIADMAITSIPDHYNNVRVDKYVIMPNHIHMILCIDDSSGRSMIAPTISRVIKQFKWATTKAIGTSIWQRSFYDHVIRSDNEYLSIWNYIDTNPIKWTEDEYYLPSSTL